MNGKSQQTYRVRVPATTSNLGPGFDCLGLALDLWNETSFMLVEGRTRMEIEGEGAGKLPTDENNLIVQAALRAYAEAGQSPPAGFLIRCRNRIPLSSGLGSSAAAILAGLMGANALMDNPLTEERILLIGTTMEGHPDNIAAALLGGLVISAMDGEEVIARRVDLPKWEAVVVTPQFSLSTHEARRALPSDVSLKAAVFNVGRSALAVEALRNGDIELLRKAMRDELHQPYRLPLIPGAAEALKAAQDLGAAAALSGAGPSVIAFPKQNAAEVGEAMKTAFERAGLKAREFRLAVAEKGAELIQ